MTHRNKTKETTVILPVMGMGCRFCIGNLGELLGLREARHF